MKNLYGNLKKKYSITKTLRFELKPLGKTLETIKKNGILEQDKHRAKIYKNVKNYCDEYHKKFINEVLSQTKLQGLTEYYDLFTIENKTAKQKEEFREMEKNLRQQISNKFRSDKKYKNLFSEKMITIYLKEFYKDNKEKIDEISEFNKFTTYFTGFNTNRQNIYDFEEKSTALSYRIINENLPLFVSNIKIYKNLIKHMPELKEKITNDLNNYFIVNSLDEVFEINYFNNTLTQIQIDLYNLLISGISEEDNKKLKGINEYVNEFNQNHEEKLPKMKQLYKQILNDKSKLSFAFETIENDNELLAILNNHYKQLIKLLESTNGLENLLCNLNQYDLSKIYLNNTSSLTNISQTIFNDWSYLQKCLNNYYDSTYQGHTKFNSKKYIEEREKHFKNKEVSIDYIDKSLLNNNKDSLTILEYLQNYLKSEKALTAIISNYEKCHNILSKNYSEGSKQILKDTSNILLIKELLDSIKSLQEFIKMLIPYDKTINKDEVFYGLLEEKHKVLLDIIPIYNKVRNYLTQKPYSEEKIKINFENSTLLNGWDLNKEKDNFGILLIKDEKYYLGILNPKNKKIFEETIIDENPSKNYKKVEYKLLPGPNKMLPKVFFSESRIEQFNPSKELLIKYKKGCHKKGTNFDINFCHNLIDFFKESLKKHEEWNNFNFKFSETKDYKDISEFYREVESQGYKINYKDFSENYINKLVEEGKLYLFQIYNKDFSEYSKGRENLHTLYWKALFDEQNLKEVVYKLNGQAEIFYRKSSLELSDTAIHKANLPINNKNPETIKNKKASTFSYDLIKNKRYTEDKFYFHAPITMNFINDKENNLNNIVNKNLKYNDDIHVIGIDRGERNLLYVVVINQKGEIVYQKSLNEIANDYNGIKYKTNYHHLLNNKQIELLEARKNWTTIENIKELKEGYMSQVIHKITELVLKYNAIIVIEDLNKGFKNSRIKVEKQVYQKFEQMLITKFNYVVMKNKDKFEDGGLLNAYQLTNKFDTFKKIGKQTGILFYIPAWNTSKIDPTTGFVNLLYIKNESLEKSKELIRKIDDIRFNKKDNYFEFDIDFAKFNDKYNDSKTNWTICTNSNRIKTFRNPSKNNEWDNKKIELTDSFKELFIKYNIDLNNIKESILRINDVKFFNGQKEQDGIEGLTNLLKSTLQIRNSITNQEEDFLISPVKNKNGQFFDTRLSKDTLPKDADANGAFNIARKGLMLISQIKKTEDDKLKKVNYNITNKEWLDYVQNRNLL